MERISQIREDPLSSANSVALFAGYFRTNTTGACSAARTFSKN